MATLRWTVLLALCALLSAVDGFADFGSATLPCIMQPISAVPRPHQLPDDVWMRYAPYSSHLLAVAPSISLGLNGSLSTSWSLHVQATKTLDHPGLRKRGAFSGIPIPTCQPCDGNGKPISSAGSSPAATCTPSDSKGPFRNGGFGLQNPTSYCFQDGYGGALQPINRPSYQLPCCPQCQPSNDTSTVITSGVLSGITTTSATTTPRSTTTLVPGGSGGTTTPINTDESGITTVTITASEPLTLTQTTLSIETITPTNFGSPVVLTRPNTVIGCGTAANGCGTVIGSGTVYLAPFGFPAVTSSGTVSGCAPKVIGCGTMIATTGTFTGTASLTACGEGTGSATLVGTGTVWPAGFMDIVSFVSSGTVSGSGRVKGCGFLTGTGTFTISEPFTTTITSAAPTVNVYVSYCPPEIPALRLAGNLSDTGAMAVDAGSSNATRYHYLQDAVLTGARDYTNGLNMTSNSTSMDLCHVCPEDAGICCPPYTDCGADGHCPWTALVGAGYARFGVNLVNVANSSQNLGMAKLPDKKNLALSRLRAPGLPGNRKSLLQTSTPNDRDISMDDEAGMTPAQVARRQLHAGGRKGVRNHAHAHGRLGIAHFHGH